MLPSETTALLGAESTSTPYRPPVPPLEPAILKIQAKGIQSSTESDWYPHSQLTPSVETAFVLVVLLHLRVTLGTRTRLSHDIWSQWSEETQNNADLHELDRRALLVWSYFINESRTIQEIEEVLWTRFPYTEAQNRWLRVVDMMGNPIISDELLSHQVVSSSISRTWKYGRARSTSDGSILDNTLLAFDTISTPRVLHVVDLVFQFTYFILLAHYTISPPTELSLLPWHDLRIIVLAVYSIAQVCRSWSFQTAPFIAVLLALFSSLPSVPRPDDTAYSVLLGALVILLLNLHLPHPPTPIFLFPFDHILPLAVLVWQGLLRILLPAVTYFLPAISLSLYLLSVSLADTFLVPLSAFSSGPSPMESRAAFLSLVAILLLLLFCTVAMLILIYPTLALSTASSSLWDRYSRPIGLEARRVSIRTVIMFADAYTFPPPFNLLQVILVRVPSVGMKIIGLQKWVPYTTIVERVLWRIIVGPVTFLIAGVWFWGLMRR